MTTVNDMLQNEYSKQPDTAIRIVKSERFQRFCLKCGKILPTKIKQNYDHNCEKPDFLIALK